MCKTHKHFMEFTFEKGGKSRLSVLKVQVLHRQLGHFYM